MTSIFQRLNLIQNSSEQNWMQETWNALYCIFKTFNERNLTEKGTTLQPIPMYYVEGNLKKIQRPI
jgi:hypothetical protein